ncbi:DUF6731 family protein [Tissierella creatinophila]|uniref:Uncharacterized protein n=1 Tax=Tissierella creatinophila DSM 6911 TaxID=1123403 RepID=A0A1U7M4H0_TISCR|nr:DUF6731 family protein [Tissierella creatinophila]OLS02191.1 hypothetical protein TICRE_18490 [Tissierella creatinophila DSM 6911]
MVDYRRNIKFQYFQVTIQKENEKHLFSFDDWAVYLDKENLICKSIELKGLKARVEKYHNDESNNLWVIRFMKLRDTNIPSAVRESEEAVPVTLDDNEYLGEDVNMLYDESNGIAMIQSNRFSLSYTRIQELVNNINPFEGFDIFINPIIEKTKSKLDNKKSKKITLGFANIERPISKTKSALSDIINSYFNIQALSGQVIFSVGRKKNIVKKNVLGKLVELKENRNLDTKSVSELIDDIYDNQAIITNAKIEIRDDDGPSLEIIDLFDNVYHDYVTFILEARQTLGFEYVSNEMMYIYLGRKSTIERSLGNVSEGGLS